MVINLWQSRWRRWLALAVISLTFVWNACPAQADVKRWIGMTNWWSYDQFWAPNGMPKAGDSIYFMPNDSNNRTVWYNNPYSSETYSELRLDATGGGTITLDQGYGGYILPLNVSNEYVGYSSYSKGIHRQSAGFNTFGGLFLGYNHYSSGTYILEVLGSLSASWEYIGWNGSGTFNQIAGSNTVSNNLIVGLDIFGNGTYYLGVSGSLSAANLYVGNYGTGYFSHSGTNSITNGLYLGNNSIGSGTYSMNAGSLSATSQYIGNFGTGTFNQSGGTNTITGGGPLYLGNGGAANGTYNLSGTGSLSAAFQNIGNSGLGSFSQSGGTNTAGTLYLGVQPGVTGTYDLISGNLSAASQYLGYSGIGIFTQTGGTNNITDKLTLAEKSGSSGTYNLQDGSLSAANILLKPGGTLNQTGGDLNFTTVNQTGGTGIFTDLWLGPNFGASSSYTLSGGSLAAPYQYIGEYGSGIFTQSGGSNMASGDIYVGYSNSANGTYTLSGSGSLSAARQYISFAGNGTFTQSGGTNVVSDTLTLAEYSSNSGTYNLQGGSLYAGNIQLNAGGTLNQTSGNLNFTGFNQTGGNSILTDLYLGRYDGSSSSYTLNGGSLSASNQYIGYAGTGTFTQSGGTNAITMKSEGDGYGRLVVGWYDNSTGTYELSGGQFKADRIVLGDTDIGTPDQPLGNGQGTLNITGGSLVVKQLQVGLAADTCKGGFGLLNLASQDAYVEVSEFMNIGPIGQFTAVPGATIHLTGSDFIISSTTPGNLPGLANLKLIFSGGPGVIDTFEVGFDIDTLEIGPDSHLQLVDLFDNNNNEILGDEGLHVAFLILDDGAILDTHGLNFTYGSINGDPSQIVSTPIPASLLLLGTGLLGIGVLGWRRKR